MTGTQDKKNIDMEYVYDALDSGTPLQELLQCLGMKYRTLYRRHKAYQESLPEGERRKDLVKYKNTGKKRVHVPMEWVYAQLAAGRQVADIAAELHVGARTLYSKHEEYRVQHPDGRRARKTLAGRRSRCGRPRKEVDMECIYEGLMAGQSIRELAEGYGISYPTLKVRHVAYQEKHRGEGGRYIRKNLIDFKKGVGECRYEGSETDGIQGKHEEIHGRSL